MVVPTVGASELLLPCLEALRADLAGRGRLVVVAQGARLAPALRREVSRLADSLIELPAAVGFAVANNRGWAAEAAAGEAAEWLGTVNDDAVIEPGWTVALLAALAADASLAAVQGVNLRRAEPARVDGCGISWNRVWQAVQVGDGGPPPSGAAPRGDIFGASATAAIYRRSALDQVALAAGDYFEPRLGTYYEDVELAVRLRAAGWRAALVPAARCRHAGSLSGSRQPVERASLLYRNRLLVLARLLGRRFPLALPRVLWRDLRDLAGGLRRGDVATAAGILRGWGRAARALGGFLHAGPPGVPLAGLREEG